MLVLSACVVGNSHVLMPRRPMDLSKNAGEGGYNFDILSIQVLLEYLPPETKVLPLLKYPL